MTAFGRPHVHLRETDSTNARARKLAGDGAPGGTVVTAATQDAGRGRQGRSWHDQPGRSLLYSAILRPLRAEHSLLPLAVPLAVCDAAHELAGLDCRVKWPNDVWAGERRKLAGILIEARPGDGWAVIGIGLNVNLKEDEIPAELDGLTASLGPDVAVAAARAALDSALGRWVQAPAERVRREFGERDALRGRPIAWEGGEGTADGIEKDGNLRVLLDDGSATSLGAGEVHLRLP